MSVEKRFPVPIKDLQANVDNKVAHLHRRQACLQTKLRRFRMLTTRGALWRAAHVPRRQGAEACSDEPRSFLDESKRSTSS